MPTKVAVLFSSFMVLSRIITFASAREDASEAHTRSSSARARTDERNVERYHAP